MKKLLTLLVAMFTVLNATAQNSQNKLNLTEGTRYMVAFPQVWASPSEKPMAQPMMLMISSKTKTKVRVMTPATINEAPRMDREYTVESNKVLKVPIPVTYMNTQSETKTGFGITVSSKTPISVSTFQQWNGNGEMARHLPVAGWGKNYYTMNFYQDRYGTPSEGYNYRPSQILLIADKDNTVVTYTPTFDTEGGIENSSVKKGQSQTVTLEKGECFLIKSKIDEIKNKEWETDLSGTLIRSSKPLAVISGHTKVGILRYPDILVGLGGSSPAHFVRNNVHDAMLPIEMSGTKFFTVPCRYTSTRITGRASAEFGVEDDRGDVIRVIALEDGTTVKTMRQDGSGFKNEFILKKGETRIVPSLEVPTYWESDKPILMGQYGKSYAKDRGIAIRGSKGEESALGHPSVESGMPMLQYVPSIDRYVQYGVFSAPEGMDNFMNIVFKADEITKIKFDNKGLNSAFGGAMRYFNGTPYACLSVPIGAGDHVIESVDPKVKWAAWTYGSLDGLTQGRAYGTPISIDLSIPCDDSLIIESQIVCGDVDGKVKLLPENSSCAQFFSFVVEDEMNFNLEADLDELTSSKSFPFQLKVVDKKKPAYAKVRVVTRSGNWIEKEFRYDGIDISFEPKEINFGTQPFDQEVCTTVVVKNLQPTPITIDELRFSIKEFTVTPTSLQLGPNESKEIKVCAVVKKPGTLRDSIIAKVNCIDLKYLPVEIRGDEPLFYAGDQNWGTLPKNAKVTKSVELFNAGKVEIIVTEYQPRGDAYFTNSTLIKSLPLTLKAGQRFTYNVDYSPNGETGVPHSLRINYTTNADREKLYSDLKGQGSDANLSVSPFSWIERVIDSYQQNRGILEYTGKVKIQNVGNTPSTIKSVTIEGGMSTVFGWKGGSTLTDAIAPNDSREIDVFFKPFEMPQRDAERKYSSEIVVKYIVNGEEKETRSSIEGTALQPMVEITNQDWGSQIVNSVTTLPIVISNKNVNAFAPLTNNEGGTMDLIVDSLVIVGNEPFIWTQTGTKTITFSPALRVNSLTNQVVYVDYIPKAPGVYRTQYRLYGNVLDTNFATLQGQTPGESKIDPIYLLTWIGTTTNGQIKGTSAYSTLLKFKEFRGGDYVLFSPSSTLLPFAVDPSTPFTYGIEFRPDKVTKNGLKSGQNLKGRLPYQDNTFATQIVFEDASGNELVGDITGDGKYLETTLRIVAPKGINISEKGDVSFILQPTPESIDSGNVESARLRILFDNGVITPVDKKSFPTAITFDQSKFPGMVEIDLVTPPQIDGFLGSYTFGALLSSKLFTSVDGLYYTIDKGGKEGSPYVVINVIPDDFVVIPVCANIRRVVDFTNPSRMIVKNNMVEVTVGIDAPLTVASTNEIGQQEIIFSGFVKKGTYHFLIQNEGLQWISANQGLWNEVMGIFVH